MAIIMANPSTATANTDDQTIRMIQTLSERFGYGKALIGNLFAWRSPDIHQLGEQDDPVGPDNDLHLVALAQEADHIVVAWGPPGKVKSAFRPVWTERWNTVADLLASSGKSIYCLKHLAGDHPRHPQILMHDTPLPLWRRPN